MPRAFRTFVNVVSILLIISLVRVSAIGAVPITILPEAPTTPAGFDTAMAERGGVPPTLTIPQGPVHMFLKRGEQSRFELFFLDVKYGFDLRDFEFYNAWCLEKDKKIRTNALHQVRLYHHDDPDLPPKFKAMPWDQIHYLINHRDGAKTVIQDAIWYLADHQQHHRPLSPEARQLIEQAALRGRGFRPAEGQLAAIICLVAGQQTVFIEVALPEAAEVEAFPVGFAPPPPGPGQSFLPPWLPLLAIPIVPPFALLVADDSSDTVSDTPLQSPGPSPTMPPGISPVNPPRDSQNSPMPIPEPASVLLIGSSLASLYVWGRIRKRG